MLTFHRLRSLLRRRLPSTVQCSTSLGSVSWRWICANHDNLRSLTIGYKVIGNRQGYRPADIHNRSFCVVCMICQASDCSICSQRPGFASPDTQSASNFHIHKAVLTRQVICWVWSLYEKSWLCFSSVGYFQLSWLIVLAPVWSLHPLMTFHLWFAWTPSICTSLLLLSIFHSSICW